MATCWTESLLQVALGLRPGETVLVLVDQPLREAGEALCAAALRLGAASARCWELPSSDRHLTVVPGVRLQAVRSADVIVSLFSRLDPWRWSPPLQAAMAAFRSLGRGRWAFGAHVDAEVLERELTGDPHEVASRADAVAGQLRGAGEIRMISDAGTDLRLAIGGRPVHVETGFLTEPGAFGNLPGGEVYVAPQEQSAEGLLVVDQSLSGIPLAGTLTLTFRAGRLVDLQGASAPELVRRLGDDPWARTLGEFALGVNPFVRPRGVASLDEKALGTAHVALGANIQFGGANPAFTHCDCVIRAPHILIDGRPLVLKAP